MTSADSTGQISAWRPEASGRVLAEGLAGRVNSFGLLRLVLASAVIFSHAFYIGGWGHDPFLDVFRGQETIGGVAVLGFFAISGYLIAKSAMTNDPAQFIWRRALRIFPAFWVVLILTALLVGPVFWVLEGNALSTYFTVGQGGPFWYIIGNADLTIRQYGIHDIFAATTPYGLTAGPVFNGSLWTLSYEWACYLMLWAFILFGVMSRARILITVLAAFLLIVRIAGEVVPGAGAEILPFLGDNIRVSLTLMFLWGSTFAIWSRRIPLDWRLAVLSVAVVVVTLRYGGFSVLGYPSFAYLLLWLAATLPRQVQWVGAKNDYSYGIYVYGFLIQQITAYFGWYTWGYWPWSLVCLAIAAGCAWLSWHLVEKRAMALKDRGPGRGVRYWWERVRARRTANPASTPL